jgi:hypothetical protein
MKDILLFDDPQTDVFIENFTTPPIPPNVWQLSPREVAMQKLLGREPLPDPKRH